MSDQLEIHEFFVEGSDQKMSHVLLHIAEPITPEEKEKGYFFALAEINQSDNDQIEDLQHIIEEIETTYYETDAEGDETFEHILQIVNRKSHHVLEYKNTLHCVVGILQKNRLVLAYHGKPQASLYYKNEDQLKETPIIDITEDNNQLFSAVVEGTVHDNDYIYIATPQVNEYLSPDRIRKILTGRTTRQSTMHISKVLDNLKNEYSFGGILLHMPELSRQSALTKKQPGTKEGSQASMDTLLTTTKNTEETLSPSLLKNFKDGSKELFQNLNRTQKKRIPYSSKVHKSRLQKAETNHRTPQAPQETMSGKILIGLGHGLVFVVSSIWFVIKKIIFWIAKLSQLFFYIITNKDNKRHAIVSSIRSALIDKRRMINDMSMISKVLFIALLVLTLIFISSLSYLKIKENREARHAQYDSLIATITEKRDEAEGKLIYGQDTKALEILNEASRLIDELPQEKEKERQKANELRESIEKLLHNLRKITVVTPTNIANIYELNTNAKTNEMIMLEDNIIVFGNQDNHAYDINPVTGDILTHSHETLHNLHTADVPKEQDKIIFISEKNNIVTFETDTTAFDTQTISFENEDASLVDLAVYNRRIYTLSPNTDQIYKHNQTQTGYDRGTPWIHTKTASLENAIAISIDGDIFVLTSDGNILKFFGGEQQGFEIHGLDPKLDNPTDIWTYSDTNNIYILEPTNKRIITIDKEGNFIGQYTSDIFTHLDAMVIADEGKTAYVLQDNMVYSFGL